MNSSGSPTEPFDGIDPAVGQHIGPYKLLERVGEGGYGVVYVAEQQKPVRRRVALKVIKLGMDTKQVIARFEAERQALAMMDHPNIAKVLDAGSTDTGRPYFVMELVRGIKITEYCDQNKLYTQARLDLFIQVCRAVQHAHQKGIIHRDIKPSNILVTLHDGVPVPKVIDFGIAKATEGRLTDLTLYTQLHQFVGTPAYMSPEQAEMSGLDVDTRSDIYSLGVLLYELLTGTTPFDSKELMSLGVDAMRRTIREQEPQSPSTRLATLEGEELTTTAKRRGAEPPALLHSIRGDLDWIVMKCLEKDRTRRYETANGVAMDIQRHLTNEPIVARPPSSLYRFQTFVRRNKVAFGAGVAVAVVLLLGTFLSSWQLLRAVRLERVAKKAADQEAKLRDAAQATERILKARNLFANGDYAGADALMSNLPPAVIEEEFVAAAPVIRGLGHWHAGGQRWRRSADYFDMLLFGPAKNCKAIYTKAPAPADDAALKLERIPYELLYPEQALLLLELDDHEGYERVRKEAIQGYSLPADWFSDTFAPDMILRTCLLLPPAASDRVALCRCAVIVKFESWGAGPDYCLRVALFEYRRGRPNEVLSRVKSYLDTEPGPARSVKARVLRGLAYAQLGRRQEAREELDWCRDQTKGAFRGKLDVGGYESGLWADWLEARTLMREADALLEATPDSGQQTQDVPRDLPSWEEAMEQALDELVQSVERNERLGVAAHAASHLSGDVGRPDLAERIYRRALDLVTDTTDGESINAARVMTDLSTQLITQGKFGESKEYARKALTILTNQTRTDGLTSPTDPGTLNTAAWRLATAVVPEIRDGSTAVELAERAVEATGRTNINYLDTLAAAYAEVGDFTNAVLVIHEAIDVLAADGAKAPQMLAARVTLYQAGQRYRDYQELAGLTYQLLEAGRASEAESTARHCLGLCRAFVPDGWMTYRAMSLLGAACLELSNYEEAEPLLLDGFQGLQEREESIPLPKRFVLADTAARLTKLYESTGKPAEAAIWHEKTLMFPPASY